MAYKEPSNKAKLAKLKEDILGDGVKEGKLEKFVELSEAINGGSGGGGDLPYLNDILNTENLTKIEVAKSGRPDDTIFTLDESNGFSYTTEPLGRKITDQDINNYIAAHIYFNGCRFDCRLGLSSDTFSYNMKSDGVKVTDLAYGLPEGVVLECMYKVNDSYSFDENNIDAASVSIEFWINPPSIEMEPKTLLGTFNIISS